MSSISKMGCILVQLQIGGGDGKGVGGLTSRQSIGMLFLRLGSSSRQPF